MILYLTYNDAPSGVYWSQVTDVVAHLNSLGGARVRLVALVSVRGFFKSRQRIKAHSPSAWVLPMVPRMERWRSNRHLLYLACLLLRPSGIMARGPLATWMALRMRDRGLVKRVCFDGRGAYAAEWEEYRIVDDDALITQFRPLEREAIVESDLRLAVSRALVDHWRERYEYTGQEHVVIPCTLGKAHLEDMPVDPGVRAGLGFTERDVVLAYSGSTAGWQSFTLLEGLVREVLEKQALVKVLFLSPSDVRIDLLALAFPGRVATRWLAPREVPAVLHACDHALLVREDSLTNRVSSPTKFAEYLRAGLKVVIPDHLGDFSELVRTEKLGTVLVQGAPMPHFERPSRTEKEELSRFAVLSFTKKAFNDEYGKVLASLS